LKNGSKGITSSKSHTSFSWSHHSSNASSFNGTIHKIKIDIPKFDDEDDHEGIIWINKLERYFDIYQIHNEEEKINIASMHLEILASDWFLWWNFKS